MKILFDNYLIDSTLSAEFASLNYPVSNLQDNVLHKRYQCIQDSDTITITFSESLDVSCFYYAYTNATYLQLRLYNIALQNRYKDTIKKVSAYTFKDNTQTDFTNDEKDLEETRQTVSSISESIDKKEFRRNWMGPSCETKTGKCEFYQIFKKFEEDNQNGKQ